MSRVAFALAVLSVLQLFWGSFALALGPRHDRLVAVPAPTAVTIDGDLSEWDLSGAIDSVYEESLAPRFTARFAVMYDANALYLAAHVTDDSPLMNQNDPKISAKEAWNGDAIQLRLTADPSMPYPVKASTFGAREKEPLSIDDRIVHLTFWYHTSGNQPCIAYQRGMDYHDNTVLTGATTRSAYKRDADGMGYTFEVALPWKLLGVKDVNKTPKAGDKLALTVQYLFSNPSGDKQIMSFNDVIRGSGFHFQTAENWGLLELSGKGNLPRAESVAGASRRDTPLILRLEVPDAQARVISAAIVGPDGSIVRTLPTLSNPKLEKSSDNSASVNLAWDGLDDDGRPLPAGNYTVRVLTHRGIEQKYVTSVHNPGTPSWKTDDGTGSWAGDHGPPMAVAADAQRVYLGSAFGEAGDSIMAADPKLVRPDKGQKLWGTVQVLDLGIVNQAMVSNGTNLFTAQDGYKYGDQKKKGTQCLAGVVMWDTRNGKPVNFQFGKRHLVFSQWTPNGDLDDVGYNLRGIAVIGDVVYGTLYHENQIVGMSTKTGQKTGAWPIKNPTGIAAEKDGKLLVVSHADRAVLRLDPATGLSNVLITGLADPYALAVDGQGAAYVSDRGSAMQVRVFDATGKAIRSIGKLGGRPAIGRYDPSGMLKPAGLAIDAQGKLWVAESDDSPRRVSVWDSKTGQLLGDLVGPGNYAVMGAADPKRPNWVSTHNTLFDVDYANGAVKTLATLVRLDAPGPQLGLDGQGRELRFHHVKNRIYLSSSGRGIVGFFLLDENAMAARPVATVTPGNQSKAVTGSFLERFPKEQRAALEKVWKSPTVVWTDLNGDGIVQLEELVGSPEKSDRIGLYWGSWVDDQLTIWSAAGGNIFRIDVERFLDNGGLKYPDPNAIKPLFTLPNGATTSSVLPTLDQQSVFVLEQIGGSSQRGGGDFEAVSRYTIDGKRLWSYRKAWLNFALSSPLFQPGYVIGAMKFIGQSKLDTGTELLAVNGYQGQFNLLTTDGLWVAALGSDNRASPRMSDKTYYVENFSGYFFRNKDNGKHYLIAGDTDTRISEVTGLETIRTAQASCVISEQDTAHAQVIASRRSSTATQQALRIQKISGSPVNTELSGWDMKQALKLDAGAGRTARIALGYDATNLYAAFDVTDDSPLKNQGGDPAMLFKTGDSVNLYLAADPKADAQRKTPVAGDTRLLATVVDDKPVVVLYEPVVANGAKREPKTFSSPTGSLEFDRVRVLDSAKVAWKRTSTGYVLVLGVPLNELGLKLASGQSIRGDAGVLFSNPGGTITSIRSFLFNKDTQITQDVPTEARLEPHQWAAMEVQ